MAKAEYKNGQASILLRVTLYDSASATGGRKTGLTSASAGLIISTIADVEAAATAYTSAGSTVETIATLGTFAAPTAGKCRFREVDATNHPGLYEIQIADARYGVGGAKSLIVTVQATGAVTVDAEIQLVSDDPYVAKPASFNLLSIDGSGRLTLTPTERDAVADALLDRAFSAGSGATSTTRNLRNALRPLVNKVTIVGTTLTVFREDDATPAWTALVTLDAAASPITAMDPA